jgi:hypothetical protein
MGVEQIMSVLDLLSINGNPPGTVPELQAWLVEILEDMSPISHIQRGSGATAPTDTQLDALFPGETDKGIAVWYNTTTGKLDTYYNNNGTWLRYTGTLPTAEGISYTPTTGADWVNPDPTDVAEALDDLAARGLLITVTGVELTANTTVNSTTYVDVTGSAISHTFTKPNAMVDVHGVATSGVTTFLINIRLNVGGISGTAISVSRTPTYIHSVAIADVFDVSSLIGGGSQTIKLQISAQTGAGVCTFYDYEALTYTIREWD